MDILKSNMYPLTSGRRVFFILCRQIPRSLNPKSLIFFEIPKSQIPKSFSLFFTANRYFEFENDHLIFISFHRNQRNLGEFCINSVPKIWDIRSLDRDVSPIGPLPQPAGQQRLEGITSLSQDDRGALLSASCKDNRSTSLMNNLLFCFRAMEKMHP
ncbi:uncharacterized protein LOC123891967 [Trifolium pratense]|uniref:uncharacterized protein LOC123891967 n=1 Tax=Trifolium pratense TaxID=57577 RepID=UPI001E6936E3|nr:uncharacterized protein LOC123891967 [Trifolium pratense]